MPASTCELLESCSCSVVATGLTLFLCQYCYESTDQCMDTGNAACDCQKCGDMTIVCCWELMMLSSVLQY